MVQCKLACSCGYQQLLVCVPQTSPAHEQLRPKCGKVLLSITQTQKLVTITELLLYLLL